ncbi:Fe-S cluster assembly protein SufD [Candidatus Pelagibacter bacterium]|nr:Fe-S cluster assembly protein SufD [Candidatus Pelagibacter bacterium]MDA9624895.1 Fe-S cluster assembly protein SufD [Candidatus Pelagibacter bacterium]
MKQDYNFDVDKIKSLSNEEKVSRKEYLNTFLETGFPNKQNEDWKFTDLNAILNKNFNEITNNFKFDLNKKFKILENFDHNYILLTNGVLSKSNFNYENKDKIEIKEFKNMSTVSSVTNNNLTLLNKALSSGGYSLKVFDNYKFQKPLIIYNYFTENLKNVILNNSNYIELNKGSELTAVEYTIDNFKNNFIKNTLDKISLDNNAIYKSISIQNSKSSGHFYRYTQASLENNSDYHNYIFTSGLKFNKSEIEVNLNKEKSNCSILSALNIAENEHQEIKTRINHYAPKCESYQKIKNVVNENGKGVYQGKIFVKDVAQKTNAYQLSKALILDDKAEFNAKPELEIYADDVKCSHGSTSGSIDLDAIHYLMTRGIDAKTAKQLLINGFLNDVLDNITDRNIKFFLESTLEGQINGY